jgi:phenylalanyl-tRNA synthetase beta chain
MDPARFRGLVEAFLAALRVDTPRLRCYDETGFETRTSTIVESRDQAVGIFGKLDLRIAEAWDIARPVYAARFTLSKLLEAIPGEMEYREPSRFPASRRDMAFLVDDAIPEVRVVEAIRELGGALLVDAVLFDRFTGRPLPEGKVSVAYALAWQAADRTLSDDDVRTGEQRIVEGLRERFGAQLRDR